MVYSSDVSFIVLLALTEYLTEMLNNSERSLRIWKLLLAVQCYHSRLLGKVTLVGNLVGPQFWKIFTHIVRPIVMLCSALLYFMTK